MEVLLNLKMPSENGCDLNKSFDDYWAPPNWLNREFLQTVLKDYDNDDTIVIHSMNIQPVVPKGEHFASCMYRISFVYSGLKIVSRKKNR